VTNWTRVLLLCLWLTSIASAQAPPEATLSIVGRKIQLDIGREALALTYVANALLWSATGNWLAVHQGPVGELQIWRKKTHDLVTVSERAVAPRWSGDGTRLMYSKPGEGLFLYSPSQPEAATCLAKDAAEGTGAWSPDNNRIAFSAPDGIYTINSDGTNRRRLLRDKVARAIAWHPDSASITFIAPGLKGVGARAITVGTAGGVARKLADIDAEELQWSPSGALLLIRRSATWTIFDPKTGAQTKLPQTLGAPTWQGSRKLRFATARGIICGLNSADVEKEFSGDTSTLVAWASIPGIEITGDVIFKSPFEGARPPESGEIRVEGYIESTDPLKGECSLHIDRLIDSSGRQTYFARGISQIVSIPATAQRADKDGKQPFRSVDLRNDLEVSVILEADKPSPTTSLSAKEIWIAASGSEAARPLGSAPRLTSADLDYDGVSQENIVVPLQFPVVGGSKWSDTFLANRDGGSRRHHGQDLMAPKMTPLVACFDGTVYVGRSKSVGGHNTLTIRGDNGWIAHYYHINNDTPGTDDGLGTDEYAFAPGLETGQHVTAGQFVAYVGDSGNAEDTAPHCHFELWDSITKAVVNAAPSLKAAVGTTAPGSGTPRTEIKIKPTEVRYDGIIREIDLKKSVIRVALMSQTVGGKSRTVTKARSVWVKLVSGTDSHVLGNNNLSVNCVDLRIGLYAVMVGTPFKGDKAMQPRVAAFAPAD
jgi:murein DD-endopeptidase MepM/ murein hydrolase activator NlpD